MNIRIPNALYLLALLLLGCGGGSGKGNVGIGEEDAACSINMLPTGCELLNFSDGETISYKLPILFRQCPTEETMVEIKVAGKTYRWPVSAGHLKGAVSLEPGDNDICLHSSAGSVSTTLRYEPVDNPQKVKMVYAIAANDDGQFLAAPGVANDLETAKQIIAVQSLMMQSATAEMIYRATGIHQTYSVVEDEDGLPIIEVFPLRETRDQLYSMEGLDIYYTIQDQLQTQAQNTNKYMVIMGFSSYENGETLAHAALGGGNLGI